MHCKEQPAEYLDKLQSNAPPMKRTSPLKAGRKRRISGSSEATDSESSYEESEDEHSTIASTSEKTEASPSKPVCVV